MRSQRATNGHPCAHHVGMLFICPIPDLGYCLTGMVSREGSAPSPLEKSFLYTG